MSALTHFPRVGVFAALADLAHFTQVFVERGVVTWPDKLDLLPDVMYAEIKKNGE